MFPKEFIIENGIVYYRKKPLHKQPLFWTTIAGGVLSLVLGIFTILLSLALGASQVFEGIESYDSDYGSYYGSEDYSSYTEYEVGETVSFDDVDISVLSMERDTSIELVDDSYRQALVVTVELENTSDKDYYFDENDFSLVNRLSDGFYLLDYRTYDVNIPEKIEAGETVEVELIYGVNQEDSFSLTFEDVAWYQVFADSL